ncbi:MAG TPA: hypothetical protein VGO92_01540 [Acidimicrobiales bacterium]|jgi:hypothetical protein|nr:hypothetical protein [Acidimicrobiales bacterium]
MTDERRPDPFEALAGADPARGHEGFDPTSAVGRDVLRRAMGDAALGQPSEPSDLAAARRAAMRRRAVVAAALALAVAGAAAAAWVSSRRPTHTLDVGCYAEARLDAATFVVRTSESQAVEGCRDLWRSGTFGVPQDPPLLAACVLESGAVGVFPGGPETCIRLQRPTASTLPPTTVPASDRLVELRNRLAAAATADRCIAPDDARALVSRAFTELGLSDWTMETGPGASGQGFDESRPCATFSIEEEQHKVTLVPFPRR